MTLALIQQQARASPGNPLVNFLFLLVVLFGIMWLLLIRPQRKKERQRQEMLEQVSKNDRVLTVGGIHGTVRWIKGEEVMLLVDESTNTKLRMSRSAISRILTEQKQEGELAE